MVPATTDASAEPRPEEHLAPLPNGGEPVYFLHIPKTAGTTLRRILEPLWPIDTVCPHHLWRGFLNQPPAAMRDSLLYWGHFGARFDPFFEAAFATVTMVRSPVERVISMHRFVQQRPKSQWHDLATRVAPTFSAFIRHPDGRKICRNGQARALGDLEVPGELAAYWAGAAVDDEILEFPDQPDAVLLDNGRATLERCRAVGVAEHFDISVQVILDALGALAVGPVAPANVADAPSSPAALSDADLELVLELNQLDLALYREAVDRLAADRRALARRLHDERCVRELTRRSVPLVGAVTVSAGDPFWGDGWWEAEGAPVGLVRWTGAARDATIDVPVRTSPGACVEVLVHAAVDAEMLAGVEVLVDGVPVLLERRPHEHGIIFGGPVPAPGHRPWTRVTVRTPLPPPWRPTEAGDQRTEPRGIAVAWLRLEAAR